MSEISEMQGKYFMQCWSAQKGYAPIEVEKAEGCWIYTTDGRKIFDLRSAHECINLGFRHPKVLEAMKAQMDRVVYVTDDFATEPTAKLVKKLAELSPGSSNKKIWLGQSGAAAVEAAIKGARLYKYNELIEKGPQFFDAPSQYPYPYKIISRYRSWHGTTSGASSVSGDPRRWFVEPFNLPGVVFAPDADSYRPLTEGSGIDAAEAAASYTEKIIEYEGGSGKVAALILESVVGSNGIIPPPKGYLKKIREICDRHNIILIMDETMTGMGRTGKMFAFEHYDIEPDIIVMGKALGMYCPLSAVIFSEKISRSFDDNIFGHGQSFSGHALGCAAALKSIEVLEEEKLIEKSAELGEYLGQKLKALADKYPAIGDVRGLGLFWTIELVQDKATKEPLHKFTQKYDHKTIVSQIAEYLFKEKNIYVPSDKFGIWVVPPLVVSKEELDFVVESIDEALAHFYN